MEYVFRADPSQVRAARHWARTTAPPEIRYDAELIVAELAANAIRYGAADRDGAPPTVTARMATRRGRLRITVINRSRPPGTPPGQAEDDLDEHGRGLAIVSALAVASAVDNGPRVTTAWAELTIPGAHTVDTPQDDQPASPDQPAQHPVPAPACPGFGARHYVATASGPGGRATACAHCTPPRTEGDRCPSNPPAATPTEPSASTSTATPSAGSSAT